jgi:tetratricopeptide (TPR) repeat protein
MALALSCARDEGLGDRYRAERLYHQSNKLYQTYQIDSRELDAERSRLLRESFGRIVEEFPASSLQPSSGYADDVRRELLTITGVSRLNVADLFLREGQVDSSIAAYRRIIADYEDEPSIGSRAQYSLAMVYQGTGRWPEAVTVFETLLQNYPPFQQTPQRPSENILSIPLYVASTYLERGDSLRAGEYFQKAREYLSGVTAQWPETPTAQLAQNQIVNTYMQQQRWSSAVSALERLMAMLEEGDDPPDALFVMAALYSDRLDKPDRARAIYEDMLQRYPDSERLSRALLAIGQLYFQRGDLPEARRFFGRVIEEYPQDPGAGAAAQYALALSYEFEGDWDKALNEFRWIVDNYPGTREAFTVPIYILEHYRQYGEEELAQSAYQQALRTYGDIIAGQSNTPNALQAQWHIAQSHIMMTSWEEAAEALELLVQTYPQSQQVLPALMSLGEIYESHLDRTDRALGTYQMILKLAPTSPYAGIAARQIDRLQEALP